MNIFVTILFIILTAHFSQAAIKCTGYNVKNTQEVLNLIVDGNPLEIFYKVQGEHNNGMNLLVNVLEKGVVKGEARSTHQYSFGTHGELIQNTKDLPRGYNWKFTQRVDPVGELSSSANKTEYVLFCKGQVPAVYQKYMN